jgi:hypothetical protein
MPSKLRFDHTPEGRKDKTKRGPAIVGPYSSGMFGMRKLLARRREELALEREAEIEAEAKPEPENEHKPSLSEEPEMEFEHLRDKGKTKHVEVEKEDTRESRKARPQVNGVTAKADGLPRSRSPPRSKGDGPYSTLRAPTSRVSRTHAPAPRLKKARNKFSLDDDDEESEWGMSVEEVKSYQAQGAKVCLSNRMRLCSALTPRLFVHTGAAAHLVRLYPEHVRGGNANRHGHGGGYAAPQDVASSTRPAANVRLSSLPYRPPCADVDRCQTRGRIPS